MEGDMLKTDEADVLALLTRALRLVEKGPDQTLSLLLRRAIIRAKSSKRICRCGPCA